VGHLATVGHNPKRTVIKLWLQRNFWFPVFESQGQLLDLVLRLTAIAKQDEPNSPRGAEKGKSGGVFLCPLHFLAKAFSFSKQKCLLLRSDVSGLSSIPLTPDPGMFGLAKQ
jgi:hypothetical protein